MSQHLISRRQSIALAVASLSAPAFAQKTPAPLAGQPQGAASGGAKPFHLINPAIAEDRRRVRFLFSYECAYCRSYHNGLVQWGQSLPKQFAFDAAPVISPADNGNQPNAVFGRLVAQAMAPAILQTYDYQIYALLQGDPESGQKGVSELTIDDVLRALIQSGIDAKKLQAYLGRQANADALLAQVPSHAAMVRTYNLTATPSVAITGKYIVTPEHANNNPQQFLLLLNGMVSRIVQGGVNALL